MNSLNSTHVIVQRIHWIKNVTKIIEWLQRTVLVRIGLRSDFTLLVVISILFCSPKMYGSQSGSRLFILREPFSVHGSFGSRVFVFTALIESCV